MSDYRKLERFPPTGPLLANGAPASGLPSGGRSAGLTYESYYGLHEKPFSLSSDPRFFYHSQPHAAAYEDLLAGVRRRESLCVLTGEIGTGKTTLCRAVLQSLDRQTFSAFVWDPFASREDLLKMVLMDFGIISVDDLTTGRLNHATRTELSYLLYEFLGKLAPLQAFAVVVIDEAQNLSLPLLEEIRILSDSDGRERQLQVILVGQPELSGKLMLPELRQVEQRITVRCNLEPLTRDGTAGYVGYRLQVADGTADRVTFTSDAIDALYEASDGVPRLINRICDRALHRGHLQRAVGIDAAIVREAVADIGLKTPALVAAPTPPPPPSAEAQERSDVTPDTVGAWLTSLPDDASASRSSLMVELPPPRLLDDKISAAVPRTYMQRLIRRSLLRLRVAVLWTAGSFAIAATVIFLWTGLQPPVDQPIELPAAPPAPKVLLRPALIPPALPESPR